MASITPSSYSNKFAWLPLCLVLTLAVGATVARALERAELNALSGIKTVMNKLEAYAMGSKSKSGLTKNELMSVWHAFDSLSQSKKAEFRRSPAVRLVTDLAVIPMNLIEKQFGDDPQLFERHLRRVERAYKRFRPAYMGEPIGDKSFKLKVVNSMKLYSILSGKDKDTRLTLKLIENASREAAMWRQRVDELATTDDIFACLDELENIFNYFNASVLKPLFDHVFPALKPNSNPLMLATLYYKKLKEDEGIEFVKGTPTKFTGPRKPVAQDAGFRNVINL